MKKCIEIPYWRQFCGNKALDCYPPRYAHFENRPARPKAIAGTGGFKLKKKGAPK